MRGVSTKRVAPLWVEKEVLLNWVSVVAQTMHKFYTHPSN